MTIETIFNIKKEKILAFLTLIIILSIGIYERLILLHRPILYDESYTFIQYVNSSFWSGVSRYNLPNNHIFHTLLCHISTNVFGNGTLSLRLPVFIFGVALIPLTFIFWKRMSNTSTGLIAAGLVATSYRLIHYSTDARGYIIQTFFFLVALWLATEVLKKNSRRYWILLSIVIAFAFYTLPTNLYAFGIIYFWLLTSALTKRNRAERNQILKGSFLSMVVAGILTLLLYTPVIFHYGNLEVLISKTNPQPFSIVFGKLPNYIDSIITRWNAELPSYFIYFTGLGIILSSFRHLKNSTYKIPLIAPTIIWPLIAIILTRTLPPFSRIWIFLIPIYLGFISVGLFFIVELVPNKIKIKKTISIFIIPLIITFWGSSYSYSVINKRLHRTTNNALLMSKALKSLLKPGDFLATNGNLMGRLRYYSSLAGKGDYAKLDYWRKTWKWDLKVIQLKGKGVKSTSPFDSKVYKVYLAMVKDQDLAKMREWLIHFVPENYKLVQIEHTNFGRRYLGESKIIELSIVLIDRSL